jgi:Putative prokaryotic signal transducing protein
MKPIVHNMAVDPGRELDCELAKAGILRHPSRIGRIRGDCQGLVGSVPNPGNRRETLKKAIFLSSTHQVIYVAANAGQAHALKNLLADHGITAYVSNATLDSVHFAPGDMLVGLAGGPGFHATAPRVVVLSQDAERARQIVLDAESALLEGRHSAELLQLEVDAGDDDPWPECPACHRPRLATCPVCETSGTHFAAAFMPETTRADDYEQLLVLCPTCDEPFMPRFPPRCEWCGHRFLYEQEPRDVEAMMSAPLDSHWNGPALAIIAGLVLIAALVFGWFYYILR